MIRIYYAWLVKIRKKKDYLAAKIIICTCMSCMASYTHVDDAHQPLYEVYNEWDSSQSLLFDITAHKTCLRIQLLLSSTIRMHNTSALSYLFICGLTSYDNTCHVITRWLYMYVWIRPKSMIIERWNRPNIDVSRSKLLAMAGVRAPHSR